MARGVFGRTDEMHEERRQTPLGRGRTGSGRLLRSLTHGIRITRPNNTDPLTAVCEGGADREELEAGVCVLPSSESELRPVYMWGHSSVRLMLTVFVCRYSW